MTNLEFLNGMIQLQFFVIKNFNNFWLQEVLKKGTKRVQKRSKKVLKGTKRQKRTLKYQRHQIFHGISLEFHLIQYDFIKFSYVEMKSLHKRGVVKKI